MIQGALRVCPASLFILRLMRKEWCLVLQLSNYPGGIHFVIGKEEHLNH